MQIHWFFCVPWKLFDFIDIMCIDIVQGWQWLKAWASAKSGRRISSLKPIGKRWPGEFLVSWLLIFQQCWLRRGWLDLLAVCNVADRGRRQTLIVPNCWVRIHMFQQKTTRRATNTTTANNNSNVGNVLSCLGAAQTAAPPSPALAPAAAPPRAVPCPSAMGAPCCPVAMEAWQMMGPDGMESWRTRANDSRAS